MVALTVELRIAGRAVRTIHLSRDAAKAPELETSSASPLRFFRMSWSFSKFVLGGGKCRLYSKDELVTFSENIART